MPEAAMADAQDLCRCGHVRASHDERWTFGEMIPACEQCFGTDADTVEDLDAPYHPFSPAPLAPHVRQQGLDDN